MDGGRLVLKDSPCYALFMALLTCDEMVRGTVQYKSINDYFDSHALAFRD